MVKLIIDNNQVEIEEGATVLDAATQAGIYIPTLCNHEELTPIGSCRLCAIEVMTDGKPGITTACTYPVAEGLRVNTLSEKVKQARRLALELLLARRPHSAKLQKLARDMGVSQSTFTLTENECILCQLCNRTCREVVGVSAISFVARGLGRDNDEAAISVSQAKCIACGSCAYICPTLAITMEDVDGVRVIDAPSGRMEFRLMQCPSCGGYWAPQKQLEHIARQASLQPEELTLCLDCR